MSKRLNGCVLLGLVAMSFAAVGCLETGGGKDTIQVSYDRKAEIEIPAKVKSLGINKFTAESGNKWGEVASDKLTAAMEVVNRKYSRYTLVDRAGLKKILDERDLQTAFGSPEAAAKNAGALKTVDAIIYGSVKASADERQATKTTFDLATQRPKTVEYTKLYCQAIVNFTMVDVGSGATLATLTTTENYDSDKDEKKSALAMFTKGDGLKPADQCLDALVDRAVNKFVAKISPHSNSFSEKLAKGKSPQVKAGNTLAVQGDYSGALEYYVAAIGSRPEDDGAAFNAGLMYECKGDFAKAAEYYGKAFGLNNDVRYARARSRVSNAGAAN